MGLVGATGVCCFELGGKGGAGACFFGGGSVQALTIVGVNGRETVSKDTLDAHILCQPRMIFCEAVFRN